MDPRILVRHSGCEGLRNLAQRGDRFRQLPGLLHDGLLDLSPQPGH